MVFPSEGGDSWPLIIVDEALDAAHGFSYRLRLLLQADGKTMEDLKALFPSAQGPTSSTEFILQAVGDFLEKTTKPPSESGYCCLRLFSGTKPVPAGEEQHDHWLRLR